MDFFILHWPDLIRLLDPEKILREMSGYQAIRTRQRLVTENPYVVANVFCIRADFLMKHVAYSKIQRQRSLGSV